MSTGALCPNLSCREASCLEIRLRAAEKRVADGRCVNCKHWTERAFCKTHKDPANKAGVCNELSSKVSSDGRLETDGDFGCVLFLPAAPGEKEE